MSLFNRSFVVAPILGLPLVDVLLELPACLLLSLDWFCDLNGLNRLGLLLFVGCLDQPSDELQEEDLALGGECAGIAGVECDDASDVLVSILSQVVGLYLFEILAQRVVLGCWRKLQTRDQLLQVVANPLILVLEIPFFSLENRTQNLFKSPLIPLLDDFLLLRAPDQETQGHILPNSWAHLHIKPSNIPRQQLPYQNLLNNRQILLLNP